MYCLGISLLPFSRKESECLMCNAHIGSYFLHRWYAPRRNESFSLTHDWERTYQSNSNIVLWSMSSFVIKEKTCLSKVTTTALNYSFYVILLHWSGNDSLNSALCVFGKATKRAFAKCGLLFCTQWCFKCRRPSVLPLLSTKQFKGEVRKKL